MGIETIIRTCTVAELEQAGALPELLAAYGDESSIPEFGKVDACFATYRALETSGALHILGVFGPDLVGLASLLVYGLPHYAGRRICAMESFFVEPHARKGGAGIKLLRAAEARAFALGASALMISAPIGSRLAMVLPRSGYRETNQVFLRVLA
ncbi:GNAT family N-acetyltransferase [Pseudomonas sp. P7759]|uniref:GNAT family N-acetyltransferase n=1 Tax=Pseudomonas sp. P7759 TaxID=2738831 RepID=UPI0015A067BA|nr:GNAT family N-acetyltransferase [Pseudomonas sp. P7759]NWC73873.1 GNAT family N-acetyltransferase [Pseudomonas sp. P7759]